jgi:hypothetical protein
LNPIFMAILAFDDSNIQKNRLKKQLN